MRTPTGHLIFFATDVHGSEVCFRKWLNAGAAYGADILIMGGDLTGKVIVPVHKINGHHHARWRDEDVLLETEAELVEFRRRAADTRTTRAHVISRAGVSVAARGAHRDGRVLTAKGRATAVGRASIGIIAV